MPINSTHPGYKDYKETAEFCEIFYDGEKKVKKQGEKLLPRLSGQTDSKYKGYKDRAIVFNVVPRTVSALIATAFRKEPKFFVPDSLKYLLEDCTGTGVPLLTFSMQLLQQILVTGRGGILVDIPEDGGNPFFVLYDGDDIINWNDVPGNEFVVLENESLVRSVEDKFELEEVEGWRELSLEDGKYVARIWQESEDKKDYIVTSEIVPLKANKPLNYIPFVPVSTYGTDFEPTEPPILGLAQLSHKSYMISADRMNAIHLIAVPTPVVVSDINKDEFGVLNLGPDAALILPSGSNAFFLEFSGQGLTSVEKAEQDILDMMGALGARLLMGQDSSSEKAAGVKERSEIANSVLTSVLTVIENAITKAMKIAADWNGASVEETYSKFNKELVVTNMDANMVNALVTAYLKGAIDLKTLFHNLKEGSLIAPETDFESFSNDLPKMVPEVSTAGVDNLQNV